MQPFFVNPHHFSLLETPVTRADWAEEDTPEINSDASLDGAELQLARLVTGSLDFKSIHPSTRIQNDDKMREKDERGASHIMFRLLSGQTVPLPISLTPKSDIPVKSIRPPARESLKAQRTRKKRAGRVAVESEWVLKRSRDPGNSQAKPALKYVLSGILARPLPLLAVADIQSHGNDVTLQTRASCSRLSISASSAVGVPPKRRAHRRRRKDLAPRERPPPIFFHPTSVLGSRGYAMGWGDADRQSLGRYSRDRMKWGTLEP